VKYNRIYGYGRPRQRTHVPVHEDEYTLSTMEVERPVRKGRYLVAPDSAPGIPITVTRRLAELPNLPEAATMIGEALVARFDGNDERARSSMLMARSLLTELGSAALSEPAHASKVHIGPE
jgi:hypothetical protein